MKTKLLYGSLAGGISLFFLGWIIYGILLMDFSASHMDQRISLPDDQMRWWALILANLFSGVLLALVLDWSGSNTWMAGFKTAAIFGLIYGMSIDLGLYSMSTYFLSLKGVAVDILASTVYMGLGGAIIGFVYSKQSN